MLMKKNRRFVVLATLLLVTAGAVLASDAEIEREQEAIAMAWIAAHNTADVDEMAKVRAKHFKRSEVADWQPGFRRMLDELGKLEPYGVMVEGPGRLMVGCNSDRVEGRIRLSFEFHEDAPDQIRQIGLGGGGGGDGEDDPGIPTMDFSDDWKSRKPELDSYLSQLASDGYFSGAVLIAKKDGVLFEGAYGLASREFAVPNNVDTRFDVGSCNKDYTRVAVMQLAAEGKLKLDDAVGKHLPDYPNKDVRDRVTIQQLLDHRSGLGDYFTDEYFETPMSKLREIEDYIPIWGPKPLLGKPGERERYSNYGYTVLGAIIEARSGMSYPAYVEARIFEPAGMAASGFFETDAVVPNVALGYTHHGPEGRVEQPIKNIYLEPAKGGPWGKSYSTARDLYRFYDAMLKGKILEGDANWMAGEWDDGAMVLAGGGPGLSAVAWIEGGLMVVVLANMDMPIAEVLGRTLSEQLR
ncbi:MAG: beta-lactamase family protein [bacterium]|nr:beta-lactamase family protein [bacterium]